MCPINDIQHFAYGKAVAGDVVRAVFIVDEIADEHTPSPHT
jgi:hypothetical protein